ncbi:MAG TPA: NRDE family protein, partial [Thermoanaerobaculia bacterium]|nr:NRDE family protein [Thermoanaerobaculia bacterium]
FRLVIAANRDEDHDRPTLAAHFWTDAPNILGGRDALHGGSWLAMTRAARFAAVTNLRGSVRDAQKRSRGELVSNFVRGDAEPQQYIDDVSVRAAEYAGFHLIAGTLAEAVQLSGVVSKLGDGVRVLTNAPPGIRWPKADTAENAMHKLLGIDDADALASAVLYFLSEGLNTNRIENEVFVAGERYGTRSSTAIVVTDEEIIFAEQSYLRGGVRDGAPRQFRFPISAA